MKWTVFETTFTNMFMGRDSKGKAIIIDGQELRFYQGDLSNFDPLDWRFCAVKKKRECLKFMGFYEGPFPVTYPITLHNGVVLDNKYMPVVYDE